MNHEKIQALIARVKTASDTKAKLGNKAKRYAQEHPGLTGAVGAGGIAAILAALLSKKKTMLRNVAIAGGAGAGAGYGAGRLLASRNRMVDTNLMRLPVQGPNPTGMEGVPLTPGINAPFWLREDLKHKGFGGSGAIGGLEGILGAESDRQKMRADETAALRHVLGDQPQEDLNLYRHAADLDRIIQERKYPLYVPKGGGPGNVSGL